MAAVAFTFTSVLPACVLTSVTSSSDVLFSIVTMARPFSGDGKVRLISSPTLYFSLSVLSCSRLAPSLPPGFMP